MNSFCSKTALEERFAEGRIALTGPLLMVFARLILAIVAQAMVAGTYFLREHPTPWQAAARWWTVDGTLVDIGCLGLLAWLTRREGVRLLALSGFDRSRFIRDLLVGLGYLVLFFPLAFGGTVASSLLIYHSSQPLLIMGGLPMWGAIYSLIVWPLIWGATEEMTYLGYSLPRLEVWFGNRWPAVLIVLFGWGIQHIALPLVPDWRYMLARATSFLPLGLVWVAVFLRTRRLFPLIVAHWAMDFVGALLGVVLPMFSK